MGSVWGRGGGGGRGEGGGRQGFVLSRRLPVLALKGGSLFSISERSGSPVRKALFFFFFFFFFSPSTFRCKCFRRNFVNSCADSRFTHENLSPNETAESKLINFVWFGLHQEYPVPTKLLFLSPCILFFLLLLLLFLYLFVYFSSYCFFSAPAKANCIKSRGEGWGREGDGASPRLNTVGLSHGGGGGGGDLIQLAFAISMGI